MPWLRRRRRLPQRPRGGPAWLDAGAATRIGPRPENQDRWFVLPAAGGVSDGMGGHAGGATAAELTALAAAERLAGVPWGAVDSDVLHDAFVLANDAVRRGRDADPAVATMGATLTVAAAVDGSPDASRWIVGNVGDSPAVHVGVATTTRLTVDDTVPGRLLREGAISEAEAVAHPYRHIVLHAIGVDERVDVAPILVDLAVGEALALMSDGVGDALDLDTIGQLVRDAPTAAVAADLIVDHAAGRGATDNATIVVLRHVASSADDRRRGP